MYEVFAAFKILPAARGASIGSFSWVSTSSSSDFVMQEVRVLLDILELDTIRASDLKMT